MQRWCGRVAIGMALMALAGAAPAPAGEAPEIGRAETVTNQVTGTLNKSERPLNAGDVVHQTETLETAEDGEGEFVLADDTKLALGPRSSIVLDTFIYDPKKKKDGRIVINATKGAFRFVTGKAAKKAYTITSPTASIGVRGTVFDAYVNDDGEMAVLLVEGEVNVCNTRRSCRRLNQRGRFFHIRRNGSLVGPLRWDGTFLQGIDFGRAFPFVDRRLGIDPVVRFRRAELLGGRLLNQGVAPALRAPQRIVPRVVPRVRPPRIRSPF